MFWRSNTPKVFLSGSILEYTTKFGPLGEQILFDREPIRRMIKIITHNSLDNPCLGRIEETISHIWSTWVGHGFTRSYLKFSIIFVITPIC